MEYKLIESTCNEKLGEIISEYIKDGEWKLYGNPVIVETSVAGNMHITRYAQAIVSTK